MDRFGYGSGSGSNPYREGQYLTGNSGKFEESPALTAFHRMTNGLTDAATVAKQFGSAGVEGIKASINSAMDTYNRTKQNGLIPTLQTDAEEAAKVFKRAMYGPEGKEKDAGSLWQTVIENAPGISTQSGSNSAYVASGSAPMANNTSKENPMQWYIDMVNQTTDKNNAWAAEQAQKQMDFQREMSNTQHQREVADLKAAGLNPVLSATGGSGASSPSGAMATPDTSNTRLLAELSMASLDSITNSAVTLARSSGSSASNSFRNKMLGLAEKIVIPTIAKYATNKIAQGLFG